jgi:hypothetical protein
MKYNKESFISAAMYLKWWSCPSLELTPVMKTSVNYLTGEVILSIHLNQILSPWRFVWSVHNLSVRLPSFKIFFSSRVLTSYLWRETNRTFSMDCNVADHWYIHHNNTSQLPTCLICQESKILYSCFIIWRLNFNCFH